MTIKIIRKCPNCNNSLKEVHGKSHYGSTIKLNQCGKCGGIWFDDWELFELEEDEVKKLEEMKSEKFKQGIDVKKEKLCPICGIVLVKFKDQNIPEEIHMEHCGKCNGLWLNHGEATEYKEYQRSKINDSLKPKKPDEIDEMIEKLLASQTSENNAIYNIASFLSTPIDSYSLRPIKTLDTKNQKSRQTAGVAADIATNALSLIFRSILGR